MLLDGLLEDLTTEKEHALFSELYSSVCDVFPEQVEEDAETFEKSEPLIDEQIPSAVAATCGRLLRSESEAELRIYEGGARLQAQLAKSRPDEPLVTIITVVYNCEATVSRCIDSVLSQTYLNIEYIVIDGGSTDGTLEAIKSYADKLDYVVSEPDGGIYNAMNKGLSLARGDFIAFLNADDYYLSQAVEFSVNNLISSGVDISYAGFVYSDENGWAVLADEPREWESSRAILGVPGGHETFFVHRDCYDKIGGYSEEYRLAADYHWMLRAIKKGLVAKPLPKNILVMSTGGQSFSKDLEISENYRILDEYYGQLPASLKDELYLLKYYKNWHGPTQEDWRLREIAQKAQGIYRELDRDFTKGLVEYKKPVSGLITPKRGESPGQLSVDIFLTYLVGASGGAERIAIETANALAGRGFAVNLICCHGRVGEPYYPVADEVNYIDLGIHPYKTEYYQLGIDGIDLAFERIAGRKFEKLDYEATREDFQAWLDDGNLWMSAVYRGYLKRNPPDIAISHMPSTYPFVLLGREADCPTLHIASLHNAPEFKFYSPLYPAKNQMERYIRLVALEYADRIGLIFDSFIEQMPAYLQSKCFVLPNYVSELLRPDDTEPANSKKTILSVGRLAPQKSHGLLLRAYAIVKSKFPDWQLKIYGVGPLFDEYRQLCSDLGLNSSEILCGENRKISDAYQKADIFAFPSVYEGFGLTVVEAMKFGLPVIAYEDCYGVNSIVQHEETGCLLSRDESGDTLAQALLDLIENAELRARMGESGLQHSVRYSQDAHIDALQREFLSVKVPPFPKGNATDVVKVENYDVALLSTFLEGGAGIAAHRLANGLSEAGHRSMFYTFSDAPRPGVFPMVLSADRQHIYDRSQEVIWAADKPEGATLFSGSYPSLNFQQLDHLAHFDVINLHWVQRLLSTEAVAYIASLGPPVVWTLHDMNPLTGGCHYTNGCIGYLNDCSSCPQVSKGLEFYPANSLQAKTANWKSNITIVCPSDWLAECARNSKVFCGSRIETIPNGLQTNVYRPRDKQLARKYLNIPDAPSVLLFACQSHKERRKGFKELVETCNNLKETGRDIHVIAFGNENDELASIPFPTTSLGHIDSDEILALGYSAADVTVLPSLEDNLPNIMLESISCGTPLAAFDSGGIKEVVIDSVTGKLAKSGRSEELAAAVDYLLDQDLSESCRRYAVENFDYRLQAARYTRLFQELSINRLGYEELPQLIFQGEVCPESQKNLDYILSF